jgi:hypothetical protein
MDIAKPVVERIRQAAPRRSLRPWADDYDFIDDNVLLLEGEVHNGRKPVGFLRVAIANS